MAKLNYMNMPIFRDSNNKNNEINIDIITDDSTVDNNLGNVVCSTISAYGINDFNSNITSSISNVDEKINDLRKEVDKIKNSKKKKIKSIKISFSSK